MKSEDTTPTIYSQLLQLMFQAKRRTYDISEEYDLTVMQSGTLMMLDVGDPKPMRVMSDFFMCDASTVTGLVDRLESRGLIQRQNHPTDRRIKLISLTARGLKLKDEIQAKLKRTEDARLAELLSEQDRTTLSRLLERIIDEPA